MSEELWERAQARKRFAGKRFSASHLGGFNRTERSKRYIFSGFLVCGVCGSKLVIVSGSGKRGYVKYGCPSHRYRGTCSNGLMIRQDRLEAQLIAGLTERISKSELIEYALKRFQERLQTRLREIQEQALKAADTISTLQNQRRELKTRANNLGEAIAQMGHSATLLQQLATLESEIERIDERLAVANQPLDLAFSLESVRDFVSHKALDFRAAFDAEPGKAKEILAGHIDQLVLMPRETAGGMVYDVSGDIDLFGGDGKAMGLVVEAYSGRSSKQRGHRALQRGALTQYLSKQERVMALDPVSGHHFKINNLDGTSQKVQEDCKRVMLLAMHELKSVSLRPKTQTVSVYKRHSAYCSKKGGSSGDVASVRSASTCSETGKTRPSQRRLAPGRRPSNRHRNLGELGPGQAEAVG